MYTMDKKGTNHQKLEMMRMEVMGAKYYNLTSSFLIHLLFPSLIFSSISPNFTVTEVPTLIFVLFPLY